MGRPAVPIAEEMASALLTQHFFIHPPPSLLPTPQLLGQTTHQHHQAASTQHSSSAHSYRSIHRSSYMADEGPGDPREAIARFFAQLAEDIRAHRAHRAHRSLRRRQSMPTLPQHPNPFQRQVAAHPLGQDPPPRPATPGTRAPETALNCLTLSCIRGAHNRQDVEPLVRIGPPITPRVTHRRPR
jgi:hypothetical protein